MNVIKFLFQGIIRNRKKNKIISILLYKKLIILFFFLSFHTSFLLSEEENNKNKFEDSTKIVNLILKDKFKNLKYSSNAQEYNMKEGKFYLNGNVFIEFLDVKIEADWIEFNWKNGDINAKGIKDKYIKVVQGDKKYFLKNFCINLNNQKGEANDVYIQEKDHVMIANHIKKENNEMTLMKEVIYTSDPFFIKSDPFFIKKKNNHPDFYLKTNKLKYFHEKKSIITGPVFFYWHKIPMPIVLPFLYIKNNNEFYGIKFPILRIKNKEIYMEKIGLFFPVSNSLNFSIFSSIYGSEKWKIETEMKYKFQKENPYHGLISFNYQGFSNKKFDSQFKWKHNKKFQSNIEFNTDINYVISNRLFEKKNEVFISNINLKKKFDNHSLLTMSTHFIQDENENKKETKLKIPEIRFLIRKNHFLNEKNPLIHYYLFDYHAFLYKSINFYPYNSPISKQKMNFKIQTSMNHTISMSTDIRFFPFLKILPKIHYNILWDFYSRCFFYTKNISTDIISTPLSNNLEINSILLKHEIEPILSLQIKDSSNSFSEKKISLILKNNLELKKNTEKNIKILEFFQISTSYIFGAPSKWENIHFMGYTDFKNHLGIKYKGGINFKEKEEEKRNKKIYFYFSFFYNFIRNEMNFHKKNESCKQGKNRYKYFLFDKENYAKYMMIPMNFKVNLNSSFHEKNTKKYFNTFLSVNGSIEITKYWKINIRTDYDLLKKQMTFANIIFHKDLRSFKIDFNWSPIGDRSWSFFIGIKDPILKSIF
ncbi:putative LPS assembly protein LptD [Blattabacterium cuenoti]|uniref:putative LPS assembly protein LptD n=1 Tax=Blattabacterium cuenoti TaxID=1653831 RepID=UPI00163C57A7|nr:putative LPS assembly protein LptD [Blattabacterium cuenoti]